MKMKTTYMIYLIFLLPTFLFSEDTIPKITKNYIFVTSEGVLGYKRVFYKHLIIGASADVDLKFHAASNWHAPASFTYKAPI
jgi:hypothetical protein